MPPERDVFRAPKGTHDVLPPASARWVEAVATFADRASRFGYGLVVTPVFEHFEVFQRVGESTEVVKKELYELVDKGGRRLSLRPEGTAGVVRAFVEHRPPLPWKVWYVAPNFRYERPQRGRYRQHWQLGVEALGTTDPALDVEVIDLARGYYAEIGFPAVRCKLNSMGDAASRPGYVAALRAHLEPYASALGDDFATLLRENPLRILDSKRPDWRDAIDGAPEIVAHLSSDATAHLDAVQAGLRELGIDFELDPRLVRGFDYYTGTTFEFASDALDAAQDAIGGGGRYDGLAEDMAGPPTPGIGFGIGLERMLLALDATLGPRTGPSSTARGLDAFVVDALGGPEATRLVHQLREEGFAVDRAYGARGVKAQWKAAGRSGARVGVMVAPDEATRDAMAVKDLETGEQIEVARAALGAWLRDHAGVRAP